MGEGEVIGVGPDSTRTIITWTAGRTWISWSRGRWPELVRVGIYLHYETSVLPGRIRVKLWAEMRWSPSFEPGPPVSTFTMGTSRSNGLAYPADLSAVRLLESLRPLAPLVPSVEAPIGRIDVTERAIWTAATLALYLSLTSFPLFGANTGHALAMDTPDPWAHLRNILAARRGTLAELGVGPVVTAGFLAQAGAATGWIDVDFGKREDRALFGLAQKGAFDSFPY